MEPGGAPASWRAFADGSFAVQDEASMLVARLLAPAPGATVADVCAAPGTKTTHIAELMTDRGRVLAFDREPERLARVREAAARLGITIIDAREGAVDALAPGFRDACDAVLVDAPCSNLGVLRRNPEVKWRRQPSDLGPASRQQREILAAASTMVKPGGPARLRDVLARARGERGGRGRVPPGAAGVRDRSARHVSAAPRSRRLAPVPAGSPRYRRLRGGPLSPLVAFGV